MSDERYFFAEYSVWGRRLDVDAILKSATPISKHSVWRRGEVNPVAGETVTSGISIFVFAEGSEAALQRGVRRFLTQEKRFLAAVRRAAVPGVTSQLGTSLFVRDGRVQPLGIELSAELLELLGKSGVSWRVGAVPCEEDGTYKLARNRPPIITT